MNGFLQTYFLPYLKPMISTYLISVIILTAICDVKFVNNMSTQNISKVATQSIFLYLNTF